MGKVCFRRIGFLRFQSNRGVGENVWNHRGKNMRPVVVEKVLFAAVMGLLGVMLFAPKPESMRIDFLDVSQGDGIFLTDGAGHHVMIDGGSTDENEVGRYRIEPFLKYHGVKKIDAWIITHSDTDHCSGALELLESGYAITYLVLAKAMPADESRQSLIDAAKENGTEIVWTNAGDSLNLDGCEMTCLYPDAGLDGASDGAQNGLEALSDAAQTYSADAAQTYSADAAQTYSADAAQTYGTDAAQTYSTDDVDVNALSQVWLFEQESLSVLFTGDIGADTEEILLERGVLQECTVLKVAHHGSKNSSSEEFLTEVSPKYAVISSGEDNSYGHPHADTLRRLSEAGSEIFNTQDCGQITLQYWRGAWRIWRLL